MTGAYIDNGNVYVYLNGSRDLIHYNHSIPNIKHEIEEDIWKPYVVFESCSNYPILHGIMAPSKDEALQEVYDILSEQGEEVELLGVDELKFSNYEY